MNVGQLVEKLQKYPSDWDIVVADKYYQSEAIEEVSKLDVIGYAEDEIVSSFLIIKVGGYFD